MVWLSLCSWLTAALPVLCQPSTQRQHTTIQSTSNMYVVKGGLEETLAMTIFHLCAVVSTVSNYMIFIFVGMGPTRVILCVLQCHRRKVTLLVDIEFAFT